MAKIDDDRSDSGAKPRQTGTIAIRRPRNQDVQEKHEMAEQKTTRTMTLGADHEEPAPEFFGQRKRPESGQFRLQVDRQTKASYATREAAEAAGLAIKKSYPILQVVVHDIAEGSHHTIESPSP